jgi:predicted transcriptional regulator
VEKLQQQLMEEQNARLEAEKVAHEAMRKSEAQIQELKERLEKARLENEEFRRMAQSSKCAIL